MSTVPRRERLEQSPLRAQKVESTGKLITEHLSDSRLTPTELRCLWLHQANLRMNQPIVQNFLGPSIIHPYAAQRDSCRVSAR